MAFDNLIQKYKTNVISREEFDNEIADIFFIEGDEYDNLEQIYAEVKSHHPPFEVIENRNQISLLLEKPSYSNIAKAYSIYCDSNKHYFSKNYYYDIQKELNKLLLSKSIPFSFIKSAYDMKWEECIDLLLNKILVSIESYEESYLFKFAELIKKKNVSISREEKNFINLLNSRLHSEIRELLLKNDIENSYTKLQQIIFFNEPSLKSTSWDNNWFYGSDLAEFYLRTNIIGLYKLDLNDKFIAQFHKNPDFVQNFIRKYLSGEKLYNIIDKYRNTEIEEFVKKELIEHPNISNLSNLDFNKIKVAPYYNKNSKLKRNYIEKINEIQEEYDKNKQDYISIIKKSTIYRILFTTLISVLTIFFAIFMFVKSDISLYKGNPGRLVGIILTGALSIPFVVQMILNFHSISKLHQCCPNDFLKSFDNANKDFLKEFENLKEEVYLALSYGYQLEIPEIKNKICKIRYSEKHISRGGLIYFISILGVQLCFIFTQNIFIYNKVRNHIQEYSAESRECLEWSFQHLPDDYKNIKSIKSDYYRIKAYLDVLDAAVKMDPDKETPRPDLLALNGEKHYNPPAYDSKFVENYWLLQSTSKTLKNDWNFDGYLKSINLTRLVSEVYMYTEDGEYYLYIDLDDYSSINNDPWCYAFKNGIFITYTYENVNAYYDSQYKSYRWNEVFTLSEFDMTSSTTATIKLRINHTNGEDEYYKLYITYTDLNYFNR